MEILTMGKVVVQTQIENLQDIFELEQGRRPPEDVRRVQVDDALVDTGATMLSLPRAVIRDLGLKQRRTRTARTTAGVLAFGIFEPVRLTIQDRDCIVEVAEIPDECPVLIGQIPLEALDLVVDPLAQKLVGNPDHGGEHMIDMF
jgi:predicted aspartyl protease